MSSLHRVITEMAMNWTSRDTRLVRQIIDQRDRELAREKACDCSPPGLHFVGCHNVSVGHVGHTNDF